MDRKLIYKGSGVEVYSQGENDVVKILRIPISQLEAIAFEAAVGVSVDHRNLLHVKSLRLVNKCRGRADQSDCLELWIYMRKGKEMDAYRRDPAQPLSLQDIVKFGLDMSCGLNELHKRAHVVHRDLKPWNTLILEGEGEPRAAIMDFGHALPDMLEDLKRTHGTVGFLIRENESQYSPYTPDLYAMIQSIKFMLFASVLDMPITHDDAGVFKAVENGALRDITPAEMKLTNEFSHGLLRELDELELRLYQGSAQLRDLTQILQSHHGQEYHCPVARVDPYFLDIMQRADHTTPQRFERSFLQELLTNPPPSGELRKFAEGMSGFANN